jgi:Rieske Fe-S protein
VAIEYTDLLTGGDVSTVEEIPNGSGAVMRRGITKIAVYKDEKGAVHECSAICPHLHCVVQWNGGEKSWDCPCHGSRFDVDGTMLNGPASRRLAPADLSEPPRAPGPATAERPVTGPTAAAGLEG